MEDITETPKANNDQRRSPTREVIKHLLRHRSGRTGLIILSLLILIAIFAPLIAPYDPTQLLKSETRRDPPCIHLFGCPKDQTQHLFGIDGNSRDLFSRVVYGSRLSLQVGLVTMGFAILVGTIIGAFAAYTGGAVDNILMRLDGRGHGLSKSAACYHHCQRTGNRSDKRVAGDWHCVHSALCTLGAFYSFVCERTGIRSSL